MKEMRQQVLEHFLTATCKKENRKKLIKLYILVKKRFIGRVKISI